MLRKMRIILPLVAVFAVSAAFFYKSHEDTSAISAACRNSAACMAAVEAERAATEKANAAASAADAYALKVASVSSEIATLEAEIADSEAQVAALNAEIAENTDKLNRQETALAKILVNAHFENNTDPIMILAGSETISDLAEKQAREENVKNQITAASKEVRALKESLEQKKAVAEATLAAQKQSEAELARTRAQLEALVSKYAHDSAAYAADAEAARIAKQAAEEEEQRAHPELYGGSSYTGYNTYPWQEDCPHRQDDYTTSINGRKVGGYVCECVSYVGWKAYEAYGLYLAWGNAYSWDDQGRRFYVVNHTPSEDSIGQSDGGTWGHVFWVESVNANGSINVTEYNNWWSTGQLTGSYHVGDFGSRTISASEAAKYNYIHLDQKL